jgi:two-component system, chemotaxis family, sensor kinase CheA
LNEPPRSKVKPIPVPLRLMAKDPLRYFRIEARDLLARISSGTLELERGGSAGTVPALLRSAHTLKGAARVVRQVEIADLAHRIEDVLQPFRDPGAPVPRDRIDELLALVDAIAARLAALPPAPGAGGADDPLFPALGHARGDDADLDALLAGLSQIGHDLGAARSAVVDRGLATVLDRIGGELALAREAGERLRLTPASALFPVLERAVRDAAVSAGRQVGFEGRGGDLRLEAAVLDVVQPALIQLVRNAVAHGIGNEAVRRAAGKPAAGRVEIEVVRDGHRACFRCSDDGAGLDLEAVRQALLRGGADPAQIAALDRDALVTRLLQGGITTAASVTGLAGRGVGLDVVREALLRLRGEVTARPMAGGGTSFELVVPLSRASLDVLVVEVGGQTAAIPLDAVRGTLRIDVADIVRSSDRDAISHRGELVGLVPLVLDAGRSGMTRRSGAAAAAAVTAVVVAAAGSTAALAVDRLRGIETVVLQPLPAAAAAAPIVLGTHLDAEGRPRLVLDPRELANVADRLASSPPPLSAPILIVDDSLTTRMLEASILESAGFATDIATSGEEALLKAQRRPYALFLVDVEMPGMDGFGLVERLRADPSTRETPCVLVSSRAAAEDRLRGAEAGASAYIVKSDFDQARFLARVASLVRR